MFAFPCDLPPFWWLLPITLGTLAALLGRLARPISLPAIERALDSRWAPVGAGLLTALLGFLVWGSMDQPGIYHDEIAYRLQAEIFASGRLAGEPAPLPEFFEQYHVLVSPRLAPKYPPGHALALVPSVWLGHLGLGPLALAGISGGLVFALARRLADPWVATLTWVLWTTAPALLGWRCSYFSETTSAVAWLAACWALLDWFGTSRRRSLAAVAIFLGWCAITRPLTAVALGLPVAVVVIKRLADRRELRELVWPVIAGASAVAIILPFNAAATGSPWRLAYTAYSSRYMPWDHPGFGIDPVPVEGLPPDMVKFTEFFRPIVRVHTVDRLPSVFLDRTWNWAREMCATEGWNWRASLALLSLFALPVLGWAGIFALASALSLMLAHLITPGPASWTLYSQEAHPVLAYVNALGVARFVTLAAGGPRGKWGEAYRTPLGTDLVMALVTGFALIAGTVGASSVTPVLQARAAYQQQAARLFALIPEPRAVVFVRYAPGHQVHYTLIQNPPDYRTARIWTVYDRGLDNGRLMKLAPARTPYLFDERTWSLTRLSEGNPGQ